MHLDGAVTVQRIQFDNENSYDIAGPGNLTLETNVGNAAIDVIRGEHQLQTVVNLGSDTNVDVAFGFALVMNGQLDLNGNVLTKTGSGRLEINSDLNTGSGTINVQRGTVLGDGTVGGDLHVSNATAAPGTGFGVLTVGGDYSQNASSTLAVEIGGIGCRDGVRPTGCRGNRGAGRSIEGYFG